MQGIKEEFLMLITPTFIFSIIVLIGLLIGHIHIGKLSLGLAGVLGVSILAGNLLGWYAGTASVDVVNSVERLKDSASVISSLGMALFISIIGIRAGQDLVEGDTKRRNKAFFGGVVTVLAGVISTVLMSMIFDTLPRELLLGAFAGGMTNTPTLALVNEHVENSTLATTGYGVAYIFGLFSCVILVQLADCTNTPKRIKDTYGYTLEREYDKRSLLPVIATIILGTILGKAISIGVSGGVLLCGGILGFIYKKRKLKLFTPEALREFGLVMFLVGEGIPAGLQMAMGIDGATIIIGVAVPIVSISVGICFSNLVLGFSKKDAITVVCGGMTSSPGFSLLQEKSKNIDVILFSVAYAGALIALLLCTRVLIGIL